MAGRDGEQYRPLLHGEETYEAASDGATCSGAVPNRVHDDAKSCATKCGLTSPTDEENRAQATSKLSKAVVFCLLFMVLEVVGGMWANSLAILTDAAHLLSDVAGFAISLFAIWASSWKATRRRSYGYYRLEILGALLSIQLIWLITGILVYEAIDRLLHESKPVNGKLMFCIAFVGLMVNLSMVYLLDHGHSNGGCSSHSLGHSHGHSNTGHGTHSHSHIGGDGSYSHGDHEGQDHNSHDHNHSHTEHAAEATEEGRHHDHAHLPAQYTCVPYTNKEGVTTCKVINVDQDVEPEGNINVRGAYLHVLGDLIQSIGVMIAGAVIWYNPEWQVIDLFCTLLFSLLVLATTVSMLRDIVEVLMESTPREIDAEKLQQGIVALEGVVEVHELHIWAITVGKILLACHVTIDPGASYSDVLDNVVQYCERDFKISHVTVQIEVAPC